MLFYTERLRQNIIFSSLAYPERIDALYLKSRMLTKSHQTLPILHRLVAQMVFLTCFCCITTHTHAQQSRDKQENALIETYWKYCYTVHLETGTTVHQADAGYELFVVFHYDSLFRLYNNGLNTEGKWTLNQGQLDFAFKQTNQYQITAVTAHYLEISFRPANTTGTFLYHFSAEKQPMGMFSRRKGELAEVTVTEKAKKKAKQDTAAKPEKEARNWFWWRDKTYDTPAPTPIQIEITGGGYYGGVDPVLRDHTVIHSNGRLVQEILTKKRGLTVTKKEIPRTELEAFVLWAEEQKFFDFERQYDCTSKLCDKRKGISPKPTPLRIIITHGARRKMVTIAIWGRDKTGEKYVDYPSQIDNIVDAVQRMANRIE
jgi:hypothetical protein